MATVLGAEPVPPQRVQFLPNLAILSAIGIIVCGCSFVVMCCSLFSVAFTCHSKADGLDDVKGKSA